MDILHSEPVFVNYCLEDVKGLIHLKQVGVTRTVCGKSVKMVGAPSANDPKFPTCLWCISINTRNRKRTLQK